MRCASCHEMQPLFDTWHQSSHRGMACDKCHGGALTFEPDLEEEALLPGAATAVAADAGAAIDVAVPTD